MDLAPLLSHQPICTLSRLNWPRRGWTNRKLGLKRGPGVSTPWLLRTSNKRVQCSQSRSVSNSFTQCVQRGNSIAQNRVHFAYSLFQNMAAFGATRLLGMVPFAREICRFLADKLNHDPVKHAATGSIVFPKTGAHQLCLHEDVEQRCSHKTDFPNKSGRLTYMVRCKGAGRVPKQLLGFD